MTAPAPASRLKRKLDSWTSGYLDYTDGVSSPKLFRKWAALVTIGAALERRVWTITAKSPTFANLFAILVGRPGIGKTEAINGVRALVQLTKDEPMFPIACHLAPTDVTKQALLDYLARTSTRRSGPDPEALALGSPTPVHYHSTFLAITELGDFIRERDNELLNTMHGLYDCLPLIEEERRSRADNPIKIIRPQASLLGGTTPAFISRTFPPAAWDEGFMARSILIYSQDLIPPELFPSEEDVPDPMLARYLVEDLRQIGLMQGQMEFTPACKTAMVTWQKNGQEPKPNHIRLEHYCTRRMRHAIKLSIIAAADRSNENTIHVEDFQQALHWLHEAELAMPGIFNEMVGNSDGQVVNELFHNVQSWFNSPLNAKQPIRKGMLVNFLKNKVPVYSIDKVIDTAVAAELIERVPLAGEVRYRPKLKAQLYKKSTQDKIKAGLESPAGSATQEEKPN